jgi:cytochrome c-type biogenesis protein CcmH
VGLVGLLLIVFAAGAASPAMGETNSVSPDITSATPNNDDSASTGSSSNPKPQTTLPDMEDEVMCPICGTLLNLSHSPAAERERVFIRRMIAKGKTDDQIKDALVVEYGPQVLALPKDEGFNTLAYIIPILIFILGALAVAWAAFSWRRNRNAADGPDGVEPDSGPTGTDSDKLEEDIAKFDL